MMVSYCVCRDDFNLKSSSPNHDDTLTREREALFARLDQLASGPLPSVDRNHHKGHYKVNQCPDLHRCARFFQHIERFPYGIFIIMLNLPG